MTARESILGRIRAGLRREAGAEPAAEPAVRLRPVSSSLGDRISQMLERLEAVGASACFVDTPDEVLRRVADLTGGASAVASNSPWLASAGVTGLPGVQTGLATEAAVREACATARFGITCADWGLADTGTLVMLASSEARFVSLLPPVHIAVVPVERLLGSLDELFVRVPKPAEVSSSMVLITGPSRTGDIELQLVRGVHGPGELHVVLVA